MSNLREQHAAQLHELEEKQQRKYAQFESKLKRELEMNKQVVEEEKKREVENIMKQHLDAVAAAKEEQEAALKKTEEEYQESMKTRTTQLIVRFEKEKQDVVDDCTTKLKAKDEELVQLKEAIGNHLVIPRSFIYQDSSVRLLNTISNSKYIHSRRNSPRMKP